LVELVASSERLTHLTKQWDGRAYARPDAQSPLVRQYSHDDEVPYRARGHRVVDGRLWVHVDVLDQVCSGPEPRVLFTAWVPAQAPMGTRWAWFWSRGC
jgi:hypothetical protein